MRLAKKSDFFCKAQLYLEVIESTFDLQQSLSVSDRSSDISAWQIRARYQNISFSLKALTGFCIASKSEDQYGILQLTEPGLASILASILSLELAISSYLDTLKKKHGSSHSGKYSC